MVGQHRADAGTTPRFTAWAPDGARLAYSYTEPGGASLGGVRLVVVGDADRPATPPIFTGVDSARAEGTSPRWSPDGRRLAVLRAGRVAVSTGPDPGDVRVLPGASAGWPGWQPRSTP